VNPLDLVGLAHLMKHGEGSSEIVVGLLDGPVDTSHPNLAAESIRSSGGCAQTTSVACRHGTFTAGILSAKRESPAPAICPGCTLFTRPIFNERTTPPNDGAMPSTSAEELAEAIVECIDGAARVLNLSVAFAQPSSRGKRELEEALDHALRRGVIVVAAAGNQGTLGSTAITRHPWVIPVAACDLLGRPMGTSNLGSSIGRRGLMAPGGEGITSLGTEGESPMLGGTSVSAPFVTGAIALLWSLFSDATAAEVKSAVVGGAHGRRRSTVVPPLLDAWAAYQVMRTACGRR
jgi:subtilisin family serine protease